MITILIRDIFLFTDFSNHAVHYAHINQLFKRVQEALVALSPLIITKEGSIITFHNDSNTP